MPKRFEVVFGFALASALWAVLIALNSDASAYQQICETNQYTGKESCTSHHVPYVIVWYVGYWLDKSGVAITALATIAIAWFTWTVKRSTDKLWSATNKSAEISERALVDLERAYIFVENIGGNLDPFIQMIVDNAPKYLLPEFSLTLINHGRTAGNIELGIIRFEILNHIPPELVPTNVTTQDQRGVDAVIIIGPGRTHTFDRLAFEHAFTQQHGDAVKNGTVAIYCHGFFSYLDIFGVSHPVKFCRRYDLRNREWMPEGGRKRNSA